MSKRGNENSQLRPEEVEALNDTESSVGGVYQRAPAEVLAQRRIIKVARRPTSSQPSANPFGGFSGLASSATAAPAANPFGGFSGLTSSATAAPAAVPIAQPFGGFSGLTSSATFATAPAAVVANLPVNVHAFRSSATSGQNDQDSEYKKKMTKLNTSMLSWMDRQIVDHPLSIWKDGLKDYVRYSTDISEKYAGTSSSNATGAEFQAVHGTAQPKVANHDKAAEVSKATAPLSTSSFSFSGLSAPAAAQSISSDGITPAGGEGEEEEGEPIMEAEKVLRNEDDKDEIICDCNCKLFRFDSGKGDAGKGEWIDVGKGVFRVTKCTESGKQRMLVRNSVGKIIFNAAFYKGMKVEQKSKGMLSFGVVTDQSGNLRNFLLKVKDVDVEVVLKSMQSAISVF